MALDTSESDENLHSNMLLVVLEIEVVPMRD